MNVVDMVLQSDILSAQSLSDDNEQIKRSMNVLKVYFTARLAEMLV